jgi:LacI family transcriptional regulator
MVVASALSAPAKRREYAPGMIRSSVQKRGGKRVTTHDVAQRAGVSQPTVSLVLSNNATARVATDTRERVIRAAQELGYYPNVIARALARRRSYAIGIIVPDLRNPFFADVVSGAERVASEAGYAVLLCETRESPRDRHLDALLERQVDGVMVDAIGAASLPDRMLEDVNLVLIDEPPAKWPGVASDAFGAGVLAAEHLLGLGHTAFGFLGPATNVHAIRMRERGFVKTLREKGIAIPSANLRRVPATAQGGQEGMRGLAALKSRPTAVFCANDLVAVGAIKACHEARISVPSDISIVGCDDVEIATLITPELTTVAIPARELGARAARMLLRAIQGEDADRKGEPRAPRMLSSKLIIRGTTAAPRAQSQEKDVQA